MLRNTPVRNRILPHGLLLALALGWAASLPAQVPDTTVTGKAVRASNAFMCMLCKNVQAPGTAMACEMGPQRRAAYLSELRTRFAATPADSASLRDVQLLIAMQEQLAGLKSVNESPEAYAARRDALIASVRRTLLGNASFRAAAGQDRAAKLDGYITSAGLRELALPPGAVVPPAVSDTLKDTTAIVSDTALVEAPPAIPPAQATPPLNPTDEADGGSWSPWWLLMLPIAAFLIWAIRKPGAKPPAPPPGPHSGIDAEGPRGRPRIARTVMPPGRQASP